MPIYGDSAQDFISEEEKEEMRREHVQADVDQQMRDEAETCPECGELVNIYHVPDGPDDYATEGECKGCGLTFTS
jgi:hypothetical protein